MEFFRRNIAFSQGLTLPALALSAAFTSWTAVEGAEPIAFNQDIRPILAENCYQCHGPDKGTREAGLRLDLEETAYLGVDGRPAIVPGDAGKSEVIRRITASDPSERMPPEETNKTLTSAEIEKIRQWIDQGAEYEPHWSYVPPEKADPPQPANGEWVRNPVDAFILDRLEKLGIEPMPEADRHTLIRRLSFDLRGLPPSSAEVDEYLRDDSPGAYERLVDRFIDSPHYGERMAVYWLDLVRYADTVGYHGDQPFHASPYRDYVIEAFNKNLPFDQFTREQLGGDLLPDPTLDQRIATAYNRLNMVTREGGAQAKEYLAKYASDRVRTTSTVWMGSTVGCAECHDHKFDPFTAKDFYSFAAFFADIEEVGVYKGADETAFGPLLRLPNEEERAKLDEFDERLAAVEAAVEPLTALRAGIEAGETPVADAKNEIAEFQEFPAEELESDYQRWVAARERAVAGDEAMEIPIVSGKSAGAAGKLENWNPGSIDGRQAREQLGSGILRHVADDFSPPEPLLADDRIFGWVYLDPENPPAALMLHLKTGGWNHRAWWGDEAIVADIPDSDGPERKRAGDLPEAGGWVRLEIPAAEIGLDQGTPVRGIAFVQMGGRAWWGSAGFLGKQRGLPRELIATLRKDPSKRGESDERLLLTSYLDANPLWENSKQKRSIAHQKQEFEGTVLAVVTTNAVESRVIRILNRGNWMDDSGEIVEPATPHFLPRPEVEEERRLTRLDLANWFVSPDNPLTSRTMVNRFWKLYFGTGLSRSLDELGNRGEWPEHAQLLDWLAVEFMESGWDVKHMVRTLVTSSTYRISSQAPEALREVDPDNRLHARQSRPRLDAEFMRDTALSISGLLVPKIGGPSIRPYQPEGYYRELNFPKRDYDPSTGEDQYRRGLYTHWQRTFLHPSLMAFDAPSRDECTAERPYSNTPLQALTLLNNPTFVEAARAFASRILTESGGGDGERVAWAWREAVSRTPNEREREALLGLLAAAREEYRDDPEAAKDLAAVGQFAWPEDLDLAELAAWTAVGRTILNLQETFVRY